MHLAQYGGTMLEYSGSDVVQEKIYASKPIQKDLIVEVLSVGDIHPPQVHNTPRYAPATVLRG